MRTKLLGSLVCITQLLLQSLPSAAKASESDGFGVRVAYSYLGFQVNNMPESIRNVPAHPEDGGGQLGAIERKQYKVDHGVELLVGYSWQGAIGSKLRHRFGVGLNWELFPAGSTGDIQKRNYNGGEGRGNGQALTFVGLARSGIIPSVDAIGDVFLAWSPLLKYEIGPNDGPLSNFSLGTEVTYWEYRALTGWDRFNTLELDKSRKLSTVIPVRLYLTYRHPSTQVGVSVGAQFQPHFDSALGKQASIKEPPLTGFVALGWKF